MSQTSYLSAVDYVIFSIMLSVSAFIGILFGCIKSRQTDTKEFLIGNRQMGILPVALSVLASFMSAITLLGTPSEIYVYGSIYIWIGVAYIGVISASNFIYMPVLYPLQLTTSHQYLGMRFHKIIQFMGGIVFVIQMTIYMGIVLYAPSLALQAVTGLNVWISVCAVGIVCTFYTSIGGIKAVMWTDVFQIIIMFAGLFIIVVRGLMQTSISDMFAIAKAGGRLEFFDFNPDPTSRHTVWSLVIGAIFTWTGIYGINQAMVQRALSSKSLRNAQIAFWINLPGLAALMLICSFCGIVVYSVYHSCDPLKAGRITKNDQLLPLFVMEFANIPGAPGLFVSCLFSGALSTVSSGLNSLAAVTMNDMVHLKWPNLSPAMEINMTKGLGIVYGILCLGMAWIASNMGAILSAALGIFGMLSGPMLGIFTLGMVVPFANWKGAMVGHLLAQTITFVIGFGYYASGYKNPTLSFNGTGCNTTTVDMTAFSKNSTALSAADVSPIFRISYMWYSLIGFLIALLIGILVSLITRGEVPERKQRRYFTPFARRLFEKYLTDDSEVETEKPVNTIQLTNVAELTRARAYSNSKETTIN